jgi:hypothetical protein
MYTVDWILQADPATREMSFARWGLPRASPRVSAAMVCQPRYAQRLMKRTAEAGAPQLVRLLVEHGGGPLERFAALEPEAERLVGWFPLLGDEHFWWIPRDLAAAMIRSVEFERFYTTTLLARAPESELRALIVDLGIAAAGSRATLVDRATTAIVALPAGDVDRQASQATAVIQMIQARDVSAVTIVPGSLGRLFDVTASGNTYRVATREVAVAHGHVFAPLQIEEATRPRSRRPLKVRVPSVTTATAYVVFMGARSVEDVLRHDAFRAMVAQRLDERRVALHAGADPEAAADLLENIGYTIIEAASGPASSS